MAGSTLSAPFFVVVVLTSVIPVMLRTIFQNAHSVDQNSFLLEINNVVVLKHMQKLAKLGKPWCQCSLGVAYLCEDYSLKRNYEQAIHWLRCAADQGLRQAHFELAKCYRDGLSVQQPHSQVFHHGA